MRDSPMLYLRGTSGEWIKDRYWSFDGLRNPFQSGDGGECTIPRTLNNWARCSFECETANTPWPWWTPCYGSWRWEWIDFDCISCRSQEGNDSNGIGEMHCRDCFLSSRVTQIKIPPDVVMQNQRSDYRCYSTSLGNPNNRSTRIINNREEN